MSDNPYDALLEQDPEQATTEQSYDQQIRSDDRQSLRQAMAAPAWREQRASCAPRWTRTNAAVLTRIAATSWTPSSRKPHC